MIRANFNAYGSYVTDSLYQWDINQDLAINGLNLTEAPEIHFSNVNMDRAIVRQSTLENGVVTVRIPNSLLQVAYTIKAYVGVYEGETFKVIETVEIPIIARTRPSDYTIEDSDEEIYSFKLLENRLNNIIANANPTEGNSELVDIRLDYKGNTHSSAGGAVRAQINELNENKADKSDIVPIINELPYIRTQISNIANGIIGRVSGEIITLDDVSPIGHTLKVKASCKNIIPYPYYDKDETYSGVNISVDSNGVIHANGTSTSVIRFKLTNGNMIETLPKGTYTISVTGTGLDGKNIEAITDIKYNGATVHYLETYYSRPTVITIDKDMRFHTYIYIRSGVTLDNAVIYVQIEKGATATEYSHYVDVSQAKVTVNNSEAEYPINVDGTVDGVISVSPNMTITSDTANVIIEAEYLKDTNKVVSALVERISALESLIVSQ